MNNMKEKLDDDYQKWPSHPFTHFLHIYIYILFLCHALTDYIYLIQRLVDGKIAKSKCMKL